MDVSSPASVARLASAAPSQLGGPVDVWINNAGYSGSFQAAPPPPFSVGHEKPACPRSQHGLGADCWLGKLLSAAYRGGNRNKG